MNKLQTRLALIAVTILKWVLGKTSLKKYLDMNTWRVAQRYNPINFVLHKEQILYWAERHFKSSELVSTIEYGDLEAPDWIVFISKGRLFKIKKNDWNYLERIQSTEMMFEYKFIKEPELILSRFKSWFLISYIRLNIKLFLKANQS